MFSAANRAGVPSGLRKAWKRDRFQGLRLSITEGARQLVASGLLTADEGNLSARVDGSRFLITPAGDRKEDLTVEDLYEVEIAGHAIPEGASSEAGMHRAIYARFPRVHAVLHSHPKSILALASEGLAPDTSRLADGGSVLDRVSFIEDFPPGTRSLAEEVALGIARAPSLVIAAHGAVTVGATVDQAVIRMIRLERLAIVTQGE